MKQELAKIADLRTGLAAAGYDPATEGTLARLLDVMQENKWSLSKVATEIGISSTSLSRLLSGKYGANITTCIGMVQVFLVRYEEGRLVVAEPFVEIDAWRLINDGLNFAAKFHRVVTIVGNTHVGKTWAVREYQRRAQEAGGNHVVIFRVSSCGTPMAVASDLCRALGMEPKRRLYDMIVALKARITPRHLIVVDEIHQVALGNGYAGLRVIELLRELLDETGCAMALIGTNVWRQVLTSARGKTKDWLGWLDQMQVRGDPVVVPDMLSHKDTVALFNAYGLPEPDKETLGVVRQIMGDWGLGRLAKTLQAAATAANDRGLAFTSQHFLAAHGQLEKVGGGLRTPRRIK